MWQRQTKRLLPTPFQWLPIKVRIRPKILTKAWNNIHDLASNYLMDFISNHAALTCCSSNTSSTILQASAFSVPLAWNPFPHLYTFFTLLFLSGLCLNLTSSERPHCNTIFFFFIERSLSKYILFTYLFICSLSFILLRSMSHPLLYPQYL